MSIGKMRGEGECNVTWPKRSSSPLCTKTTKNVLYSSWTTVVFWDVLRESQPRTPLTPLVAREIHLLDTIEELSDILVLDSALVGDGSG